MKRGKPGTAANRAKPKPDRRLESARRELERHVLRVQADVRSCSGCGLCCTKAYNVVQILPIEGERIAEHLRSLDAPIRKRIEARLRRCVDDHSLGDGAEARPYTCAFLESDFRCFLPLEVKPIACLAFNPITDDACDQEPERYHAAHAPVAAQNRERGLEDTLRSIPVAVLRALRFDRRRK